MGLVPNIKHLWPLKQPLLNTAYGVVNLLRICLVSLLRIGVVNFDRIRVVTLIGFSSIQKVYYKSPLAHSLLGQTVGDIVKIGNLDNFVEIIKITNN